jgi:hypothetical protein
MIKVTINAVAEEDPRVTRVFGDIRIVQACHYGIVLLVMMRERRAPSIWRAPNAHAVRGSDAVIARAAWN